jgi:hypothetical protein
MSELDVLSLLPEKFRSSELLIDLIAAISDKLLDKTESDITVLGSLKTAITSTSTTMELNDDYLIPTTGSVDLVLWSSGIPSVSGYELITATYSGSGNVFTIERGKHGTTASSFEAGSLLARYTPLSIMELFDKIDGLRLLVNPKTVPSDYLQSLADLVGVSLSSEDQTSAERRRNELIETVEWYKIKGSYGSVNVISSISGLDLLVQDLYTKDYSTFIGTAWFVGDEGENPPELSLSEYTGEETPDPTAYYKSPHFGLSVLLNKVYDAGTYYEGELESHLWRPSLFSIAGNTQYGIRNYIEKTRPVNTVPHYGLLLTCPTDESGVVFTVTDGKGNTVTETAVTSFWEHSQLYFDNDLLASDTENDIYFDDDTSSEPPEFDTSIEAFVASIDTWRIGTEDLSLSDSDGINTSVTATLTGSISRYAIYDDRIEFYFTVPKATIQNGMTEIGLYQSSTGNMVLISTFPDINKDSELELQVKVIVYRTIDPEKYKTVTTTPSETSPEKLVIRIAGVKNCGTTGDGGTAESLNGYWELTKVGHSNIYEFLSNRHYIVVNLDTRRIYGKVSSSNPLGENYLTGFIGTIPTGTTLGSSVIDVSNAKGYCSTRNKAEGYNGNMRIDDVIPPVEPDEMMYYNVKFSSISNCGNLATRTSPKIYYPYQADGLNYTTERPCIWKLVYNTTTSNFVYEDSEYKIVYDDATNEIRAWVQKSVPNSLEPWLEWDLAFYALLPKYLSQYAIGETEPNQKNYCLWANKSEGSGGFLELVGKHNIDEGSEAAKGATTALSGCVAHYHLDEEI